MVDADIAESACEVGRLDFSSLSLDEVKSDKQPKQRGFTNAVHQESNPNQASGRVVSESTTSKSPTTKSCVVCNEDEHLVPNCTKFKEYGRKKRWDVVVQKRLCRSCLKKHASWRCLSKSMCGIDNCKFKHHPLLHRFSQDVEETKTPNQIETSNVHRPSQTEVLFRVVPVVLHGDHKTVETYAFLDEGSSITLIDDGIADELQLSGPNEELCLKWTGDTVRKEVGSRRVALQISGRDKTINRYQISNVRTVTDMNLPIQSLNWDEARQNYKHLHDLPLCSYQNARPRILIGLQHWSLALPLTVREGKWGEPVATETRLGWALFGSLKSGDTIDVINHYHICDCTHKDEEIHRQIKDFFTTESFGVKIPTAALESKEDERARDILEQKTQRKDGRFETALLWRSDNITLPDSFSMAKRRLLCLENKMQKNPALAANLKAQIEDYHQKGYIRKLNADEVKVITPRTWYLPLFCVTNPNKPGKVRMVWDAAATVNDMSLNLALLKGPDFMSSLPEILFRFRENPVALSADIQEMFHQVGMNEADQNSQRFLWRNDKSKEVEHLVMRVMTFGATCSPSSAQFVKNKNALEFKDRHPAAVDAICNNHYVDDWLGSYRNEEEATAVAKDVKYIHSQAGFNIRNWSSNSKSVLSAMGETGINGKKDLNLSGESNSVKVLGLWWSTERDSFYFSINYERMNREIINGLRRPTKREVLRTLMLIYDPLGLIGFFLVYVKVLLQDIWRSSVTWDEPVSDYQQKKWLKWTNLLPLIEDIRIPRCYINEISGDFDVEIHSLVDASESAFAATVYFRIRHAGGIKVVLVAAKTKVAPLKPLSVPRLELQAAVLGSRLVASVRKAHTIKFKNQTFWSDSIDVLCWIRSDHRKFRQFVAHRIGEILDTTEEEEWRYVPTKLNIADVATKWASTPDSSVTYRWFNGPEFLGIEEEYWPVQKAPKQTTSGDIELLATDDASRRRYSGNTNKERD